MEITGEIIQVVVGAATVAAAYGVVRSRLNQHEKELEAFRRTMNALTGAENPGVDPAFVRRSECAEHVRSFEARATELSRIGERHDRSLGAVLNFARWFLTTKEGMSLNDANDVLENGR